MLSYITQQEVRVTALNINKLFECVWHCELLTKFTSFSICGNTRSWISSFYLMSAGCSTVLDGFISKPKALTTGVPQGRVLGPLLFLMFKDDLASHLDNDHLFADDSILHSFIENPECRAICTESLHVLKK